MENLAKKENTLPIHSSMWVLPKILKSYLHKVLKYCIPIKYFFF